MPGDDVVIVVDDHGRQSQTPEAGPKLHDLLLAMRPGIPGVGYQLADVHFFKAFCIRHWLFSFPRRQQALHQIVLRIVAAVTGSAVFLYDLKISAQSARVWHLKLFAIVT